MRANIGDDIRKDLIPEKRVANDFVVKSLLTPRWILTWCDSIIEGCRQAHSVPTSTQPVSFLQHLRRQEKG